MVPNVRPTEMLLRQCDVLFDPLAIEHDEWLIKILHDLWVDRWISESLEDVTAVLKMLSKAGWAPASYQGPPRIEQIDDSITRALKRMLKTKSIDLTTVFATRVLIDIHEIVGEKGAKIEEDLRHRAALFVANSTMETLTTFCFDKDHFLSVYELIFRTLEQPPRAQNKSIVKEASAMKTSLNNVLSVKGTHSVPISSDLAFYSKHNPVYLGLESLRLQLEYMHYVLTTSNCIIAIPLLAHLYNAARQSSFLDIKWQA
jgi:hypothetical protein